METTEVNQENYLQAMLIHSLSSRPTKSPLSCLLMCSETTASWFTPCASMIPSAVRRVMPGVAVHTLQLFPFRWQMWDTRILSTCWTTTILIDYVRARERSLRTSELMAVSNKKKDSLFMTSRASKTPSLNGINAVNWRIVELLLVFIFSFLVSLFEKLQTWRLNMILHFNQCKLKRKTTRMMQIEVPFCLTDGLTGWHNVYDRDLKYILDAKNNSIWDRKKLHISSFSA